MQIMDIFINNHKKQSWKSIILVKSMFDLGSLKNCNNSVSSCLTKTTNGFSELETTKKKEQT